MTSAHSRYDTRIFIKQCRSLAAVKFNTNLVVADDNGHEIVDGVQIHSVGKIDNRYFRMLISAYKVFSLGRKLKADIYHIHDPELIPWGYLLSLFGYCVIFDSHESVAKQILTKPYLSPQAARIVSFLYANFEYFFLKRYRALIGATPSIRKELSNINQAVITLNNFPLLDEFYDIGNQKISNPKTICYVGGITEIRGLHIVVKAMNLTNIDCRLAIAGPVPNPKYLKELKMLDGWKKCEYLGVISRDNVKKLFGRSHAGIVTFLDAPNHRDSRPNKLYEYLSASLPVIASNFQSWEELVTTEGCGLCIDPTNETEIAHAIDQILSDVGLGISMGKLGRKYIENNRNWEAEFLKLEALYNEIADE